MTEPNPDDKPPEGEPKGELPDDPAVLRSEIEKLRRENAGHRTKNKELQTAAEKLTEIEEQGKTESQRMTESVAAAEKRAAEAESRALRLEVAGSKGLTAAQARRLVGSTKEELEADAEELLETFAAPEGEPRSPSTRPTERLRGGGDPTEEPEPDVRKIVDSIPRGV